MREIIYHRKLLRYGADILYSPGMQLEKDFLQHGEVSVFAHSIAVACVCLLIARLLSRCLKIRLNERALVRGALLHDYFLYDWHVPDKSHRLHGDWHVPDKSHRLHGFFHARRALRNASRDFALGEIERDMIAKHMFPLNLRPPVFRESIILCIADKLCAADETLTRQSRYWDISRRY